MKTRPQPSNLDLADTMHGYMHTMADTGERDYMKFNSTGDRRRSRENFGLLFQKSIPQAMGAVVVLVHI